MTRKTKQVLSYVCDVCCTEFLLTKEDDKLNGPPLGVHITGLRWELLCGGCGADKMFICADCVEDGPERNGTPVTLHDALWTAAQVITGTL